MKIQIAFLVFIIPSIVFSWGGRGHHSICSAAVFLVQDPDLKNYLKGRPHIMGHLCNVPDIVWKNMGSDISKIGSPSHYINPEIIGLKASEIVLDYKKIVTEQTGNENKIKSGFTIKSIPTEFGSNWWRADQFFRRAIAYKDSFNSAQGPQNSQEEQNDDLPFNKLAYDFTVNLGLMGHFVGDNAQPFHVSADYDGYATGHGGIHAYYEDTMVAAIDADLEQKIIAQGKKLQKQKNIKFLSATTVLEKMQAMAILSSADLQTIYKNDVLVKKSELKNEKGMEIKIRAERNHSVADKKKFEKIIVMEMARAATLLANLWDEAYKIVGRPKLLSFKSYKYPLTPEFVIPDYYELPKSK